MDNYFLGLWMRFHDVQEFIQYIQNSCPREEGDRVRPPLNLTFLTVESPIMSVVGGDTESGGDFTCGGGDSTSAL